MLYWILFVLIIVVIQAYLTLQLKHFRRSGPRRLPASSEQSTFHEHNHCSNRAQRALRISGVSLFLFFVLALLTYSNEEAVFGAQVFAVSLLVFVPLHIFGIRFLQSIVAVVGVSGMALMVLALVWSWKTPSHNHKFVDTQIYAGATPPELPGVTHRWVEVAQNTHIHIAEAGPADGPPVLLVHGFPQNWWQWNKQIGPLADAGYRVLAPDLRGAGWSSTYNGSYTKAEMAEDLITVIKKLNIGPVAVIAHDMGGPVSGTMMLKHPELVRGYFGINTFLPLLTLDGKAVAQGWRLWFTILISMPGFGPNMLTDDDGSFLQILASWLGGSYTLEKADMAIYLERMTQPDRALAGSRWFRSLLTQEAWEWSGNTFDDAKIDVPVRWLIGTDDPVVTTSLVRGYADRFSDYSIETIDEIGHWISEQEPQLVTKRMLAFLEQL